MFMVNVGKYTVRPMSPMDPSWVNMYSVDVVWENYKIYYYV